ncbi:MAG TPA: hypothetical protein VK666_05205 [Chryseolinea sp.]|nr:hypothetical protein [Chryseolinea sp.]
MDRQSKGKNPAVKTVLLPFHYDYDFKAEYAWSFELATRLKGQLSLFTSIPENTLTYLSPLYQDLIEAKEFHIRTSALPYQAKHRHPVSRHFVMGDFETTFLHFVEECKADIIVLPDLILSKRLMNMLIISSKQLIALPRFESDDKAPRDDRSGEAFFLETLHHAACYNLPSSFFRTVSEDKGLFNYIAALFSK